MVIPPIASVGIVEADLPLTRSMNSIAAYMGSCCVAGMSALELPVGEDLEVRALRARRINHRVGKPMMSDHVIGVWAPKLMISRTAIPELITRSVRSPSYPRCGLR